MSDKPSERELDDLVYISDYGDFGLGLQVKYSSNDLNFGDRSLESAVMKKIWRVYDIPEVKAEMQRLRALYGKGQSWGEPDQRRPQGSEYTRIQNEVYEMAKAFQAMMSAYWSHENSKKIAILEKIVDKYADITDEEVLANWRASKAKEDK